MMSPVKTTLSISLIALVSLSACGDDGNDVGLVNRQAADRAAEFRLRQAADTTTTTTTIAAESPAPSAGSDAAPATTVAPEPTTPPVEPTGVVIPVFALDNTFRPEIIEINVGDEVIWENRGQNEHDILRVEGEGWGVEAYGFQPGAVYAHVFTEPGEYAYYCSIHGNETVGMVGTIIVNG
jgi:plastocyanin